MRKTFSAAVVIFASIVLASCDSGFDQNSISVPESPPPAPPAPPAPTEFNVITGVAAKGIIAGATVSLIDSEGIELEVSTTTGEDGSYSLDLPPELVDAGISTPLQVVVSSDGTATMVCDADLDAAGDNDCLAGTAEDGSDVYAAFGETFVLGADFAMRSMVASLPTPTDDGASITVNATPLTEIATALALGSGVTLTEDQVASATEQVKALVQTVTGADFGDAPLTEIPVVNLANVEAAAAATEAALAAASFSASIFSQVAADNDASDTIAEALAAVSASVVQRVQATGNPSAFPPQLLAALTASSADVVGAVASRISAAGLDAGILDAIVSAVNELAGVLALVPDDIDVVIAPGGGGIDLGDFEIPDPTTPEEPTDPEPTDPEPTDPEPTDPEPTDPEPTDPEPTDPEPTDPEPTDPEPTDPEPTDPEPTDPEPTDPEPTDPEPTDPEPTDPEPTDPEEPGGDNGGSGGSSPPPGDTAAATLNAALVGDYTLEYGDFSSSNANDPFSNGQTVLATVGADGSLTIDGKTLTNPFHRIAGATLTNEVGWYDADLKVEYALSSNDSGTFNEINVGDQSSPQSSGFPQFLGQLTGTFVPADGGDGGSAPSATCGDNGGGSVTGIQLVANCAGTYNVTSSSAGFHSTGQVVIDSTGGVNFDGTNVFTAGDAMAVFDRLFIEDEPRIQVNYGADDDGPAIQIFFTPGTTTVEKISYRNRGAGEENIADVVLCTSCGS